MLFHITMASMLGGMMWSCVVALGYMVFLRHNLRLAGAPAIAAKTSRVAKFDNLTVNAYADYATWLIFWAPFYVISTLNVAWLWWEFSHNTNVGVFHLALSALSVASVLTAVFGRKIIQDWVYGWSLHLSYAKDDVLLERLAARMTEIEAAVGEVLTGDRHMTVEEMQRMMAETAAIVKMSDSIVDRQAAQLKFLKQIADSMRATPEE